MSDRKKTSVLITNFDRLEKLLLFHLLNNDSDFEIVGIVSDFKVADIVYFLQYDSNHGKCQFDKITYQDSQKRKKIVFEKSNKKIMIDLLPSTVASSLAELKKIQPDVIIDFCPTLKSTMLSRYAKAAGYVLALYQNEFKSTLKFQSLVFHFNHSKFDTKKNICLVPQIEATTTAILLRSLKEKFAVSSCSFDLICGPKNNLSILDSLNDNKKYLTSRSIFNNLIAYPANAIALTTVKMLDSEKISLSVEGQVVHVPATTGALLSLKLNVKKLFKASEVNDYLQKEADAQINFSRENLVSQDVVSTNYYGVVDKSLTKVLDDKNYQTITLGIWLDSESSMAISCFRTLQFLAGAKENG